jgi:hypothetical protein
VVTAVLTQQHLKATVKLPREEQMVSQNALDDERKKPAKEMLIQTISYINDNE